MPRETDTTDPDCPHWEKYAGNYELMAEGIIVAMLCYERFHWVARGCNEWDGLEVVPLADVERAAQRVIDWGGQQGVTVPPLRSQRATPFPSSP